MLSVQAPEISVGEHLCQPPPSPAVTTVSSTRQFHISVHLPLIISGPLPQVNAHTVTIQTGEFPREHYTPQEDFI